MSTSEPMAPVDITWLRMDQPTNPMVIVGVLTLEGPVNLKKLERLLAARLLAIPRFRQRIEKRLTGLWWSDDPHLNIDRHIKRVRLPGSGGRAELEHFVADLASQTLDQSRPLWQFHVVERYEGGAVLIVRIHHAIADGIALIRVMLSLTDDRPDASVSEQAVDSTAAASRNHDSLQDLFEPYAKMFEEGVRLSGEAWREFLNRAADPMESLREGAGIAIELARLLTMPNDSPTRFKGKPSGHKKVAWTEPIALSEVKAVSRVFGCSPNDMLTPLSPVRYMRI